MTDPKGMSMTLVTTLASTQDSSAADPEEPSMLLVKMPMSNHDGSQEDAEAPIAILVHLWHSPFKNERGGGGAKHSPQ